MTHPATGVRIRPSRQTDLELISMVEKASDALFRSAGIELVADAAATEPADYENAHEAGRLLVATGAEDQPLGFVRLEILDRNAHVEQVSVHPDHQRHGIGTALLKAAEDWALLHGYCCLTLTTYRDVAWNGPYYTRLGWSPLPEQECGPDLADARQHERHLGLDRWPRQAMIKQLDATRAREPAAGP